MPKRRTVIATVGLAAGHRWPPASHQALAEVWVSPGIRQFPGARPIAAHRLEVAAGGGALDLDETVKSYAYFRHE